MNREADHYDIDAMEIARRLDFIGFTEEDAERIRAAAPTLAPHTSDLAEDLYAQIRTIPALEEILRGHLSQCKIKQSAYLKQLLDARVDRLYTASRTWIGEVHRQMGVEPRWYLAAYCYLQEQIAQLLETSELDPLEAWRGHRSLIKLVVFDMILALDAYQRTLMEYELRREDTIREHALPNVLEVEEGVLVLPLSGSLDAERVTQLEGAILQSLLKTPAPAWRLVLEVSHLWLEPDTFQQLGKLVGRIPDPADAVWLAGVSPEQHALLAAAELDGAQTRATLAETLAAVRKSLV